MTPKHFQIALGELGTAEVPGKRHNARVVQYQGATGLDASDDETPWCGAFVAWCILKAGLAYRKADAARARSWLDWGVKLRGPIVGAVVVLKRGTNPAQGHVGFYAGKGDDGRIRVLGGNQGNKVSIASYPAADVLGYRWPKGLALPPEAQSLGRSGVVQGSTGAAVGGAAVIVDAVAGATDDLQRADGHLSSGTILGAVIGVIIIAAAAYAIWSRVRAAKQLREAGDA